MTTFEQIFRSGEPRRDKFLARLFGIFNEELVRVWARCPQAPYEDLGRPTVREKPGDQGYTLDFMLCRKDDGQCFIAEMKCELEYKNYRYLRLNDAGQLAHHKGRAFRLLLQEAGQPGLLTVQVGGEQVASSGAILVWGATSPEGTGSVMDRYGFEAVLSAEAMLRDLQEWRSGEWKALVAERRAWCEELFTALDVPG